MVRQLCLLCYISVLAACVFTDIKKRTCPNSLILASLCLGMISAWCYEHMWSSLMTFVCINAAGILIHSMGCAHAGDLKFASVCVFLFNPLSQSGDAVWFVLLMAVFMLIFWCLFYEHTFEQAFSQLKQEGTLLVGSWLTGSKPPVAQIRDVPKNQMIPLTIPILLAALSTGVMIA